MLQHRFTCSTIPEYSDVSCQTIEPVSVKLDGIEPTVSYTHMRISLYILFFSVTFYIHVLWRIFD